jgi:Secretion system C-terminal sorting domain
MCPDGTTVKETKVIDIPFDGIFIGKSGDETLLTDFECVLPGDFYSGFANVFSTGIVKINKNFTFKSSNVIMENTAGFDVITTKTFTLKESTMLSSACNCLWRGINVYGNLVTSSNTTITDALTAIRPFTLSKLNLKQTRFRRNYLGIYSKNTNFSVATGFESNQFDGTGPIKEKCGMVLTLKNNDIVSSCGSNPPFAFSTELGYAGIYLEGVTAFNLPSLVRAKQNQFSNFVVGMAFYDTQVNINKNSFFVNMREGDAYGVGDDIGILYVDTPAKGSQSLTFKGNGKISVDNDFDGCEIGLLTLSSSNAQTGISISEVKIVNASNGISAISDCGTIKGLIANNYIQSNQPSVDLMPPSAIFVGDWVPESSNLQINNNKIEANLRWGIHSKQVNNGVAIANSELEIFRNEIRFIGSDDAIFVEAGKYVNVHDNAPSGVDPNLGIYMGSGFSGVYQSGGYNNNVACNLVRGTANVTEGITTRNHKNGTITSNRLLSGKDGLRFQSQNNNSRINCNTMEDNAKYGLLLESGGRTDAQGDPSTSLGNKWVGSFTLGAFADNALLPAQSPFFVRNLPLENPNTIFPLWFFNSVPLVNAPNCPACPTFFNVNPPDIKESDIKIATSKMEYSWYPKSSLWSDEAYLYEKLLHNPKLMTDNETMKRFFDNKSTTAMAKLINGNYELNGLYAIQTDVQSKMDNINEKISLFYKEWLVQDSLIQITEGNLQQMYLVNQSNNAILIDSFQRQHELIRIDLEAQKLFNYVEVKNKIAQIEPTNTIESNYKIVLNKWAKHSIERLPFTEDDLEILISIGLQCEDEGGFPVLMAKMMYSSSTGIYVEGVCDGTSNREADVNHVQLPFNMIQVYPNPADKSLQLDFGKVTISDECKLTISNIFGKVLMEKTINPKDKSNIDVSSLPVGACVVVVTDGDKPIFQKVVIIQH